MTSNKDQVESIEADDVKAVDWADVVAEDHADTVYQSAYNQAADELEKEVERHRASLRAVRTAQGFTQVRLAEALGTSQGEISRIERQSDLYLSTLRSYIEAAGGELVLIARLPNLGEIEVTFGVADSPEQGDDFRQHQPVDAASA